MHKVIRLLKAVFGDVAIEKAIFVWRHRYWPNFKHPRTFSEFILNRMLYNTPANAVQIADKYAVRDYARERVGEEHLNTIFWIGNDTRTLDWSSLPKQFVAKATHGTGSKYLLIANDKSAWTEEAFRTRFQAIIDTPFGSATSEKFYLCMPQRGMIERRLVDDRTDIPSDYKFYVFHGRTFCVHIDHDRFGHHTRGYYSPNWELLPFELSKKSSGPCPLRDREAETHAPDRVRKRRRIGLDQSQLASRARYGDHLGRRHSHLLHLKDRRGA
jgi:hypothetical protein